MATTETARYRVYAEQLRKKRTQAQQAARAAPALPPAGVTLQLTADVITRLRRTAEPHPGHKFAGSGHGARSVPMHVDAVDTADELTRLAALWISRAGVPTTGHGKFWRYPWHANRPRKIRGLVDGDTRPVQRLVNAYRLAERQPGHVEPPGLSAAMAQTLTRVAQSYSSLIPVVREGLSCTN